MTSETLPAATDTITSIRWGVEDIESGMSLTLAGMPPVLQSANRTLEDVDKLAINPDWAQTLKNVQGITSGVHQTTGVVHTWVAREATNLGNCCGLSARGIRDLSGGAPVKPIQKAWLVVIWAFIFWIIVLISRDAFSQVVPCGAPGGAGATINVSNGAPTGNCGTNGVFYPTPLFAVPAGGSQQSISAPLILNGAVTFNSSTSFINSSISLTNAGIFTNAQANLYDLVQVGGINNASFYASTFGGVHQTDAISGGIQIPAGATVTQVDAIAGYCNALADSAGRTKANCGALFGLAGANANNSAVWGINTVIFDAPTAAGHNMTGYENDIDLVGTPAFLKGFILTGLNLGGVVPATATGYEISTPFKLPIGFLCGRASCNVGAQFADKLSTNPSPSQSVQFIAHDGGGVAHISQINEDANGNEVVTDVSGGPNPITQRIGSGTATSAGTVINAGTSQTLAVTVTGATATDVAICATNAAYPATWQTGIQVLPPVVTSNTVTLTFSNPTAGNIAPVAQTFRCTVTR